MPCLTLIYLALCLSAMCHPALFHTALCYPAFFCAALPCAVLPCPAPFYPALPLPCPQPALPCPALFCPALHHQWDDGHIHVEHMQTFSHKCMAGPFVATSMYSSTFFNYPFCSCNMAANKGRASVSELKENQVVGRHSGVYEFVAAALTLPCCFLPQALTGLASQFCLFYPCLSTPVNTAVHATPVLTPVYLVEHQLLSYTIANVSCA